MSVLAKAVMLGGKDEAVPWVIVPHGATSVVAKGASGGWMLVFETPDGPVEVWVGDMQRAVKLVLRLTGIIAAQQRR